MSATKARTVAALLGAILAVLASAAPLRAYPAPEIPRDQIPADMPAEVRRLVEKLYSPNDYECVSAAGALGRMGPAAAPAAPFLASILRTGANLTPNAAAGALWQIGPAAVDSVILAVHVGDRHARKRAFGLLERFRDPRSIPLLVTAAADGFGGDRALRVLTGIGAPARDHLLTAMASPDPDVRRQAAAAMPAFVDAYGFRVLSEALGHPDGLVRAAAARSLEAMLGSGRQSLAGVVEANDHLLAAARHPDVRLRRAVVRIVARTSGDKKIAALAGAIGDPDRAAKLTAIEAVRGLGDDRVVDALIVAVRSDDALVRAMAGEALGQTRSPRAVAPVLRLLRDGEPVVRQKTAAGLTGFADARGIGGLVAASKDDDPLVRTAAARALGGVRDRAALAGLLGAVADPDKGVRLEATALLAVYYCGELYLGRGLYRRLPANEAIGLFDQAVHDGLVRALGDSEYSVRGIAIDAVGRAPQAEALRPLMALLDDGDWQVRWRSLAALGRARQLPDTGPVRPLLRDPNYRVREQAERILARPAPRQRIRSQPRRPLQHVIVALRRSPERYGPSAGRELAAYGAEAVGPAAELLEEKNVIFRRVAAEALAGIDHPSTLAPLVTALKDDDEPVALLAADPLGRLGDRRATASLCDALGDRRPSVREAAARALAAVGDPAAMAALSRAARDKHWRVRRQAVDALGKLKDPRGVPALRVCLRDGDWDVRRAAADALGAVGGETVVEPLIDALGDGHWYVLRNVHLALQAVTGQALRRDRGVWAAWWQAVGKRLPTSPERSDRR